MRAIFFPVQTGEGCGVGGGDSVLFDDLEELSVMIRDCCQWRGLGRSPMERKLLRRQAYRCMFHFPKNVMLPVCTGIAPFLWVKRLRLCLTCQAAGLAAEGGPTGPYVCDTDGFACSVYDTQAFDNGSKLLRDALLSSLCRCDRTRPYG